MTTTTTTTRKKKEKKKSNTNVLVGLSLTVSETPTEQMLELTVQNTLPDVACRDVEGERNGNQGANHVEDDTKSADGTTSVFAGCAESVRVTAHQECRQIEHEVVGPVAQTGDFSFGDHVFLEALGERVHSLVHARTLGRKQPITPRLGGGEENDT